MKFKIGGFTHKGIGLYEFNEDNMLINNHLSNEGEYFIHEAAECVCFVSDGVGGNSAGDFASKFVLEKIKEQYPHNFKGIKNYLMDVNELLIETSINDKALRGCACTLSGLIIKDDIVDFVHVGDSEIWLLRNDMFYKITKDEVLNEDDWRSPLINYFGSTQNNLSIKTDYEYPYPAVGDIFVICSDGLFKAIKTKNVKPVLLSDISIEEKILKIKENALYMGADDNVTVIIVEIN